LGKESSRKMGKKKKMTASKDSRSCRISDPELVLAQTIQ